MTQKPKTPPPADPNNVASIYADEVPSVFVKGPNVELTFVALRILPGPDGKPQPKRYVVQRITLPADGAIGMLNAVSRAMQTAGLAVKTEQPIPGDDQKH